MLRLKTRYHIVKDETGQLVARNLSEKDATMLINLLKESKSSYTIHASVDTVKEVKKVVRV